MNKYIGFTLNTSRSSSSARTQLNLLEQLTSTSSSVDGGYESDGSSRKLTIRDQLAQLVGDRDGDSAFHLIKYFLHQSANCMLFT
ncbi:hypothetical protein Prudu_009573 [Prunus dulcis]|uniref:Uncharacterized protein n=1 Tax=Prunus dulcis TaxID=3755 RepID=A0A4Y1R6S1_PRUDU|nr:hypothetical protein Prudu_009573 [Prunus dulcis]